MIGLKVVAQEQKKENGTARGEICRMQVKKKTQTKKNLEPKVA